MNLACDLLGDHAEEKGFEPGAFSHAQYQKIMLIGTIGNGFCDIGMLRDLNSCLWNVIHFGRAF